MKAVNLRTEQLREPMGIDVRRPYVSWNCADGITQTAYELKAVSGDQEIYNSGKVESNKMNAALEAELGSRQSVSWQVRLWDENNEVGEWSQEAFFDLVNDDVIRIVEEKLTEETNKLNIDFV